MYAKSSNLFLHHTKNNNDILLYFYNFILMGCFLNRQIYNILSTNYDLQYLNLTSYITHVLENMTYLIVSITNILFTNLFIIVSL